MDRAPAVAGTFYPADEVALANKVEELLGPNLASEPAIAVVAPHAGYVYSGAVAGEVYRGVRVPDVAIVMCPNHTGMGARAAVISSGAFALPGGRVPIADAVAEELRDEAGLTEDARAHAREHALEVHLPFLRAKNPLVSIVPVCLGALPFESCMRIGTALADVITRHGRQPLIVASTDMSHYISADAARSLDRMAIDRIEALDPEGLYRTVFDHGISMCGVIPTTAALVAARALGAREAKLVRYTNSGDVSGDYERVVGYAGLLIR